MIDDFVFYLKGSRINFSMKCEVPVDGGWDLWLF